MVAAAVGAVCATQTPGGAGNLVINGTLAAGGVATLDVQRNIAINPGAGNLTGINFTITGTDDQGRTISEVLAGANGAVSTSVLNYKTVTQIAISAAGVALTVDTVATGASREVPLDHLTTAPFSVTTAVEVTGTLNYTVQYTYDDIFAAPGGGPFTWFPVASLTAQTTSQSAALSAPVTAVRLLTNSGAGTGAFIVIQEGI